MAWAATSDISSIIPPQLSFTLSPFQARHLMAAGRIGGIRYASESVMRREIGRGVESKLGVRGKLGKSRLSGEKLKTDLVQSTVFRYVPPWVLQLVGVIAFFL